MEPIMLTDPHGGFLIEHAASHHEQLQAELTAFLQSGEQQTLQISLQELEKMPSAFHGLQLMGYQGHLLILPQALADSRSGLTRAVLKLSSRFGEIRALEMRCGTWTNGAMNFGQILSSEQLVLSCRDCMLTAEFPEEAKTVPEKLSLQKETAPAEEPLSDTKPLPDSPAADLDEELLLLIKADRRMLSFYEGTQKQEADALLLQAEEAVKRGESGQARELIAQAEARLLQCLAFRMQVTQRARRIL